ncbi:gamma-glutamyltransferase [Halobacillus andaensis]|uniref:gamma-glutamyltransferase n=1 Tax=Halobacillus andaensis TaxID=1176239 RepID=UPI003D725CB6
MQNKIIITVLSVIVIGGMWFYYQVEGVSPELAIFNQGDKQADRDPVETVDGYGVSASNPLAVEAGMEILEKGGSAADAAVTVSYVLSVVEPYGSGIGGEAKRFITLPTANRQPTSITKMHH